MIFVIEYEKDGQLKIIDEVDVVTFAIAFYRAEWDIRMKYHDLVIGGRRDIAFTSNYEEGTIYIMDETTILHRAKVWHPC